MKIIIQRNGNNFINIKLNLVFIQELHFLIVTEVIFKIYRP